MKKRNLGFMKLVGATVVASLLLSVNVHAEELEDLVNSEDIETASEEINTLDNKVDDLSEKCSDSEVTEEISSIADGIDNLDDLFSAIANDFTKLRSKVNQHKKDIISGLNSKVYVQDNISENASYEDIIAKINDIDYKGTLNVTLDSSEKYTLESGYYDGGTIDVSAIVEAARQEGFKAGKEDGYNEGFKAGKADGDKVGYSRGLADGERTGYSRGSADGDRTGYSRGLADGKTQGVNMRHHDIKNLGNMSEGHSYTWVVDGDYNILAIWVHGHGRQPIQMSTSSGTTIYAHVDYYGGGSAALFTNVPRGAVITFNGSGKEKNDISADIYVANK
ncbi:hypothetical protein [Butyrivibrio sp. M55]|uniref:hypothetical protein n=1 Tax=Butyrivibrio sp. M55 TaxID=1855323 RepID=UPI0008E4B2CF|nr:hypothetical protein [Butyrivibrio sp. M55]SFU79463.1 hypothetical protein SAMN05216540_11073 [Butyrivibrio sp. M55]